MFELSWGGVELVPMLINEPLVMAYVKKDHFFCNWNTETILCAEHLRSSWYNVESEVRESERRSVQMLSPAFSRRVLELSLKRQKTYWEFISRLKESDLSSASNAELLYLFSHLQTHIRGILGGFQATQPEFLKQPELALKRIISEKGLDVETVFSDLTTYTRIDAINREEMAFAELKKSGATHEHMKRHVENFPWLMLNTYSLEDAYSFLKTRLAVHVKSKALDELTEEKKLLKEGQERTLDSLGDPTSRQLSALFQEFAFNRIEEKTCWASALWLSRGLLEKIASIGEEDVPTLANVYRAADVEKVILGGNRLDASEVAARKRAYLFHYKPPGLHFYSGEAAIEERKKLLGGLDERKGLSSFKGTCASPGKATGRVRIIVTGGLGDYSKEMHEFKKGEILVTGMTQITMTPICAKAGAIVTNEGGITSHAAIISRELGIPCVIGTRVATRELKDGDLVEVDATNGIVRIVGNRPKETELTRAVHEDVQWGLKE